MILALVILLMANQGILVAQPIIVNTLVAGSLANSHWDTAAAYLVQLETEKECLMIRSIPAVKPEK